MVLLNGFFPPKKQCYFKVLWRLGRMGSKSLSLEDNLQKIGRLVCFLLTEKLIWISRDKEQATFTSTPLYTLYQYEQFAHVYT